MAAVSATSTVLITGGAGLIGGALLRRAPAGYRLLATQRSRLVSRAAEAYTVDLANEAGSRSLVRRLRPDLVIHTAYSQHRGETDVWLATRNVVDACRETGAHLVHLSTDALLDGEHAPYGEDAAPAPVHEYGRWKARAEDYVREMLPEAVVIRTSLVVELTPPDPRTAWILDGLRSGSPPTLFADEIRCPIAVDDLADQIWEIAELPGEERGGVWHLAGPEALSRHAIGVLLAARAGLDASALRAAVSSTHPEPRPRDLRLATGRADRTLRTRARGLSEVLLRTVDFAWRPAP
jgi:dTDP-4-dehydrorhamnose reductase